MITPEPTPVAHEPSARRPHVTLAMFAYRQEQYVAEAVESCLQQTYTPLEIILSDDCSPDRTFAIIEEIAGRHHPREGQCVRLNRMPRNSRLAGHLNHVLHMATGEIVVLAAGDDVCLPHKVEALVEPFLADERVVGAFSTSINITADGTRKGIGKGFDVADLNDPGFVIRRKASVWGPAHAFRKRAVFDDFGDLRPDVVNEDVALALREALVGRIAFVPEPTVLYRIGVGISAEKTNTIRDLKLNTPLRRKRFGLALCRQFLQDLEPHRAARRELYTLAEHELAETEAVLALIERPWAFGPLLRFGIAGRLTRRTWKHFLRRNCPDVLLRWIYRMAGVRVS